MLENFAFLYWVIRLSSMVLSAARLLSSCARFAFYGLETETRSPDHMCWNTLSAFSDLLTTCADGTTVKWPNTTLFPTVCYFSHPFHFKFFPLTTELALSRKLAFWLHSTAAIEQLAPAMADMDAAAASKRPPLNDVSNKGAMSGGYDKVRRRRQPALATLFLLAVRR